MDTKPTHQECLEQIKYNVVSICDLETHIQSRLLRSLELYRQLQLLNPNDDFSIAIKDIQDKLKEIT